MGKRKSNEEEITSTCQSIAKKLATLTDMIQDGRLSNALTNNLVASTTVKEHKKHRGPKLPKDPLAPTRNLTSYIHYTNDNRKKIVDANPGMAPRDVARTLGEGWRGLSEKEKARYDKLAKDDLKRYNDEMKTYKESIGAGSGNNNNSSNDNDSDTSDSSSEEEDELASDEPTPKSKKSTTKKSTSAKVVDDASDSSSSSSSSSSSEESSSSDSSDSDDE